MSTWTIEQIRRAESLRATLHIDAMLAERAHLNVKEVAAATMAKQLTNMAHPFGIELHQTDFEVQWDTIEDEPWHVVGRMRWHPTVRKIELRGGHLDGIRMEIRDVGQPFRVARPVHPVEFFESAANEPIGIDVDVYQLVGWREDERVWVYQA